MQINKKVFYLAFLPVRQFNSVLIEILLRPDLRLHREVSIRKERRALLICHVILINGVEQADLAGRLQVLEVALIIQAVDLLVAIILPGDVVDEPFAVADDMLLV